MKVPLTNSGCTGCVLTTCPQIRKREPIFWDVSSLTLNKKWIWYTLVVSGGTSEELGKMNWPHLSLRLVFNSSKYIEKQSKDGLGSKILNFGDKQGASQPWTKKGVVLDFFLAASFKLSNVMDPHLHLSSQVPGSQSCHWWLLCKPEIVFCKNLKNFTENLRNVCGKDS